MRITVSHEKTKEEVIRSVDRAFDDLFRNIGSIPLRFVQEKKTWEASRLTFLISAKMGFVSTPIKGTIDVRDTDLTIDVDLGMLERIIAPAQARAALTSKVRVLLS